MPPLNFSQTGKRWPKKDNKQDKWTNSGKYFTVIIIGTKPFRPSKNKVAKAKVRVPRHAFETNISYSMSNNLKSFLKGNILAKPETLEIRMMVGQTKYLLTILSLIWLIVIIYSIIIKYS